jgi:hypothetical protein
MHKLVGALAAIVLLSTIVARSQAEEADRTQRAQQDLLRQGRMLTADQVDGLEAAAAADADDLDARLQLLGYYFRAKFQSKEASRAHQEIVLWLINRDAESPILGSPEARIHAPLNPDGHRQAADLWAEKTKAPDAKAKVLGNAADFFLFEDKKKAEQLLKRAQEIEPESVEWRQRLGRLFQLQSHGADAESRKELSKKALAEFERATKGMDDRQLYVHLADLAKTAFAAGENHKAEKYAMRLISLEDENENKWNSGNAVHHGNLILGRLALRAGDVDKAKYYLLKAGGTKGSPQLNSFGPNMALAKDLLEKGERDVVLEYFTLCGKFWDRDELKAWREQVELGKTPQFGANLVY